MPLPVGLKVRLGQAAIHVVCIILPALLLRGRSQSVSSISRDSTCESLKLVSQPAESDQSMVGHRDITPNRLTSLCWTNSQIPITFRRTHVTLEWLVSPAGLTAANTRSDRRERPREASSVNWKGWRVIWHESVFRGDELVGGSKNSAWLPLWELGWWRWLA